MTSAIHLNLTIELDTNQPDKQKVTLNLTTPRPVAETYQLLTTAIDEWLRITISKQN